MPGGVSFHPSFIYTYNLKMDAKGGKDTEINTPLGIKLISVLLFFPSYNLRVVPGIYYVTLRYRNNLQQQIELMILPPGINLLNYGWMPGVEG